MDEFLRGQRMEHRDLRHLADTYCAASGLPPCGLEPADLLVLPLADGRQLGVQWQPGEALLFANAGRVVPVSRRLDSRIDPDPDDEDEDEDEDEEDEGTGAAADIMNLGSDEHGRWGLHINGATRLATLCLHVPLRTLGPTEFAAAVEAFRRRFPVWAMALGEPAKRGGEGAPADPLAPGFALLDRA